MLDHSPAQDPGELFDVVTSAGEPTGIVKPRAAVHRDGDWHRAVHVWVAGLAPGGAPFLLAQRRSPGKDTWPGRLDATVGGHYRAGEGLVEALRETEEEIGLAVERAGLRRLGTRVCVNDREPGVHDRELQDVFLHRDDRPLTAFRPDPIELAALLRLPLPGLLDLLGGDATSLAAEQITPDATVPEPVVIDREDFIPSVDAYFYRVAIAAGLVLRGERHAAV